MSRAHGRLLVYLGMAPGVGKTYAMPDLEISLVGPGRPAPEVRSPTF